MCKRFGAFNRERRCRRATPLTSQVDSGFDLPRVSRGIAAGIFLEPRTCEAPRPRRIAVKTFLASLGGALAMLLVVATWQARTSASQFASAPQSWALPPASTAVPANIATLPQGVMIAAPSGGVVPVAYTPSGYQPVASNLVQLDTPSAAPARYIGSSPRRVVYRETKPRRNWAKTALVIGGSTGAGAGIGALTGGKKGALVGAALGGGAATLFEAFRH
jgi:hypothetical protein